MEQLAEAMYEAIVAREIDRIQQQFPGKTVPYSYNRWKSLSPDQQLLLREAAVDFLDMDHASDLESAHIEHTSPE